MHKENTTFDLKQMRLVVADGRVVRDKLSTAATDYDEED